MWLGQLTCLITPPTKNWLLLILVLNFIFKNFGKYTYIRANTLHIGKLPYIIPCNNFLYRRPRTPPGHGHFFMVPFNALQIFVTFAEKQPGKLIARRKSLAALANF